jgi:hemoglobin
VEAAELYAATGEEGFARLTAAFYSRVATDDILEPMYRGADLAEAEARLRDFLIDRFGGPERYIEARGHPRLRMPHGRFAIDRAARDRWVQLMSGALEKAKLPAEAEAMLRPFLEATATFLINR